MEQKKLKSFLIIIVCFGILAVLRSVSPSITGAAVLKADRGSVTAFAHGNPTALASNERSAFRRIKEVIPIDIGQDFQEFCKNDLLSLYLGLNFGEDKKKAEELAEYFRVELYLDDTLQNTTTSKVEKYVDAKSGDKPTYWYQFLEFIIYERGRLSAGNHTTKARIYYQSNLVFEDGIIFKINDC